MCNILKLYASMTETSSRFDTLTRITLPRVPETEASSGFLHACPYYTPMSGRVFGMASGECLYRSCPLSVFMGGG